MNPDPIKDPTPTVRIPWPDPTPEMLNDYQFNQIWECIKSWDIAVPGAHTGYMGATGNHARAIYDALHGPLPSRIKKLDQRWPLVIDKWGKDLPRILNWLKEDTRPNAELYWTQLVLQELNMWAREDTVSEEEFNTVCTRRGFLPQHIAYIKEMLEHIGVKLEGE